VSDPKQALAVMRTPDQRGDQRGNQTGDQRGNRSVGPGHDPSSDLSGNHGGEPVGERRRAVIEPDAVVRDPTVLRLAFAAPGSVDGVLVSYEPDAIAFTIDAPRDGIVVLNEIAFPGWTVEVDGSPGTPVVANYLLRAVTVGPGPHRIRWRFAPPHLRALIDGYLLALAVMLVAAAWPRRPRVRGPARP
jgi:hypothetical protein